MPEVLPGCVQPGVGGTGWVRASNHPAPWSLDQPHKMPVCPGRQASFRFATHIGGSQFNGTDNRRVDQTRRWWGGRASNPHLHSLAQPRACECRSFPDELPAPYPAPKSRSRLLPFLRLRRGRRVGAPAQNKLLLRLLQPRDLLQDGFLLFGCHILTSFSRCYNVLIIFKGGLPLCPMNSSS